MAHPNSMMPFGPATPSVDDADDKRARDVAWWAKAILLWLLQVIGVSSAVIFGMFSTLAWQNSEIAKSQADSANLLSMVALCAQLDDRDERYQQMCQSINIAAEQRLRALAESMLGDLPRPTRTRSFTPSSTPSTPSTSKSQSSSTSTDYSTSSKSTTSVTSTTEPPLSSIAPSLIPTTEFTTSRSTTSMTRIQPTATPPNSAAPTDIPNVGSHIGVGATVAITVTVIAFLISMLSLAALWPVWKKYRREKTRR